LSSVECSSDILELELSYDYGFLELLFIGKLI
jgi:hypothetical protein